MLVRSTRVWQGVIRGSVKDEKLGTIAAFTLNPSKARILLRLALAKTQDWAQIQRWFSSY
jgi:L-asparaginase